MFRFYWKTNRNQSYINSKEVKRIEGGYWFTEVSDETIMTYKILYRNEINTSTYVEVLEELPKDFIQTPCWEQKLQVWNLIKSESEWSHWSIGEFEFIEIPKKVCEALLYCPQQKIQRRSEEIVLVVPDWILAISFLDYETLKKEIYNYLNILLEQQNHSDPSLQLNEKDIGKNMNTFSTNLQVQQTHSYLLIKENEMKRTSSTKLQGQQNHLNPSLQRAYKKTYSSSSQQQQRHHSSQNASYDLHEKKNSSLLTRQCQIQLEVPVLQNHHKSEVLMNYPKNNLISGNLIKTYEQHQSLVVSSDQLKESVLNSPFPSTLRQDKQVHLAVNSHSSIGQKKIKQVHPSLSQKCLILPL